MKLSMDPQSLETAISAVGFGKFNIFLVLVILPAQFLITFENAIASYISPVAQCALNLSLNDKGLLNAISYVGAISGGVLWGFLVDTIGRKKALAYGCFVETLVVIITALAQSFYFFADSKIYRGIISRWIVHSIMHLPFRIPFYSIQGKIQMVTGFIAGIVLVGIPLSASFFLPLNVDITLFGGYLLQMNE
ncbi:hypothetical protein NQ317_019403 [Molorchus minor]|uniref:Major facilitator superfamily (MFS) profile domain-containing protein n=1 Tax=Molorchus minor TaxID=1323400 RepID=A0ABQ9JIB7_9CUCU|nr:hypothetical protein NQ317_019403 [Molorchus minor]